MCEDDCSELKGLVIKIQQHEKKIAQLIEIIAATNCKVSELTEKQKKREHILSLS